MKNLKFLKFPVGGSRSQGFRKYLRKDPFHNDPLFRSFFSQKARGGEKAFAFQEDLPLKRLLRRRRLLRSFGNLPLSGLPPVSVLRFFLWSGRFASAVLHLLSFCNGHYAHASFPWPLDFLVYFFLVNLFACLSITIGAKMITCRKKSFEQLIFELHRITVHPFLFARINFRL